MLNLSAKLYKPMPPTGEVAESGIDTWLLLASAVLLALGLLMVASASLTVAENAAPLLFVKRQCLALIVALLCAFVAFCIPINVWLKSGPWWVLGALLLLILVLIPGIGKPVNGSWRWLPLVGGFNLQVSELAKLAAMIYLAGYLAKRQADEVVALKSLHDILGPMLLLAALAVLLLLEPDYGAAAVLILVMLSMMFLAGVNIWHFVILLGVTTVAMGLLIYSSDYRWQRFVCFIDPWADPFQCGYQATQALIAFGRGGLLGVGLGSSVQKLNYLPEAHNDFLFAILAEELGLLGILAVLILYATVVWRCFHISIQAEQRAQYLFVSYLAYGIGFLIGIQALLNMGVNLGLLPPKGLTLPLLSYGGSSLVVICIALAIVLRCDWEMRHTVLQQQQRKQRRSNPATLSTKASS